MSTPWSLRRDLSCKVCAGPHDHKKCTSRHDTKHANFHGPHAESYSGCPRLRAATSIRKTEILQRRVPYSRQPFWNPEVWTRCGSRHIPGNLSMSALNPFHLDLETELRENVTNSAGPRPATLPPRYHYRRQVKGTGLFLLHLKKTFPTSSVRTRSH